MALPTRCTLCPVQPSSLCGDIGVEAATALSRVAHRMRIPAGQVIYGAHHEPRSFAILVSGVVKLVVTKADGRQQIVGLQFPSDFVGRPLANPTGLTAEAATPLDLCCFSGRAFDGLMRAHPEVSRALIKRMVADLDRARSWTFLLGRPTAQEKVAGLLCIIAERMRAPAGCALRETPAAPSLSLPLTRMEMAECLSLRLETVCRQLTQLKARGVISTMGRRAFDVLDMDALRRSAAGAAA